MILDEQSIEKLYKTISKQVIVKDNPDFCPENIAGCDVSYREKARVSCVIFNVRKKQVVEEITFDTKIPAAYVPSKFAKRELPLIVEAISTISTSFDCIIVDGHGIAHQKRAGIACFVGIVFDLPTIGCAKNILIGKFEDLVKKKGTWSSIIYKKEKVGEAVCTKDGTKPIFVSPGHKIGFENSRKIILNLAINSKYPEPLRLADINTRRLGNSKIVKWHS
jgi:deoxyribonuclease V